MTGIARRSRKEIKDSFLISSSSMNFSGNISMTKGIFIDIRNIEDVSDFLNEYFLEKQKGEFLL